MGLAYYVQDLILKGYVEVPDDVSSTSKPMQWNKPRGRKIVPQIVAEAVFSNPLNCKRKKDPIKSTLTNPVRTKGNLTTQIRILKDKVSQIHAHMGASYLMSEAGSDLVPVAPADKGNILKCN